MLLNSDFLDEIPSDKEARSGVISLFLSCKLKRIQSANVPIFTYLPDLTVYCVLFIKEADADVTVAVRGCCGARFQYGRTNGSVDQWDQMKDVTKLYSLDFDIQSGHNQ